VKEVVKIEHLSCKVGYRYLLHDINWTVNEGEHWVLFGINGCGKTTLLSIISGFRSGFSGTLEVFGETYSEENILKLRKKIGFVSSSFFDKILTTETVLQIVLSGKFGTLGIDGDVSNEDVIHAKQLLKELRLGDKMYRTFDSLSKGERQNAMIARAFMGNPEILILDEPGTGLDVFAREHMLSTIKDLAERQHMTIIYVTHYCEEILELFDHCVLMQNGKFYRIGATKEIFTAENLEEMTGYPVSLHEFNHRMQLEMKIKSNIENIL